MRAVIVTPQKERKKSEKKELATGETNKNSIKWSMKAIEIEMLFATPKKATQKLCKNIKLRNIT